MRHKSSSQLHNTAQPLSPPYTWGNPGRVIDRNGHCVDTTGEVWRLHDPTDSIDINWNTLDVASDIKAAIRAHIAYTIESRAPMTANQVFSQLKYCFSRMPILDSITALSYEVLEGLLTRLRVDNKAWHFHYIRKWYQWCEDQGLPGFEGSIAVKLYRLKVDANSHGERVMTRDVNDGPLSHDEHYLVRQAIKTGRGTLVQRVIVALLLELGARPSQLIRLEKCDFDLTTGPSGHAFYSLDVPRVKQRTVGELERKRRRISPELGRMIEELIEQNQQKYGDRGVQMPLLCVRQKHLKKLTGELQPKYELHMKVIGFAYRVQDFARRVKIVSPRTGRPLNLHPRRLRYTFFTMLAEQGTAINHLAELADHSDTRSIWIYVASTSNIVDRLNLALGEERHYADTINRFNGQVVLRTGEEDQATVIFGATPTLKNLGGIGFCGADFLCNLYPPLSCYICPKFQAWIDGPHADLLLELEVYVEQLIKRNNGPSDRIPHQLVDVITAIRQLLQRIKEVEGNEATG